MAKDYDKGSLISSTGQRVTSLPALDAPVEDFMAYRERYFQRNSMFRTKRLQRASLAYAYAVEGRHWAELDTDIYIDGVRGYVLRDMKSPEHVDLPRPVTNYIANAVEIELSSLGKRELIPNVHTSSRDPRVKMAASHAKEILLAKLDRLKWPDIRELANFVDVITGTVGLRTWWDTPSSKLTIVGSANAAICPNCGSKLASDRVPRSTLSEFKINNLETIRDLSETDPDDPLVQITNCPTCTSPFPLARYDVDDIDLDENDIFDRPLGEPIPAGDVAMEVVTPFEMHPENGGAGVYPHNFRRMGSRFIRDLDWVLERHPECEGHISPMNPYELMRDHHILGDWQIAGHYNTAYDSGIFDNHTVVEELVELPNSYFPQGACITYIGERVVKVMPLLKAVSVEVETQKGNVTMQAIAPYVNYSITRFKLRIGEMWGKSLVDDLFSPQNRVNGIDAQIIDLIDRWGSPNIWVPEGMQVMGPEWLPNYGSGKIIRYMRDPTHPNDMPKEFGGSPEVGNLYQVRDRASGDVKELGGPASLEIGEAPKNISTTSGLQLLGEAAERRRGPRERGLTQMSVGAWRSVLDMLWTFRVEDDEYDVVSADGVEERKAFNRTKIMGQTKVVIEKQGYVDKSLWLREATREAQADQLYDLSSQASKKKILEYRGLPTDVNEGENRQVDLSNEQWSDYIERGVVPRVDETLDNYKIHYQVLGTRLMSPEGKELEREYQWPEVLKRIAGWELDLAAAETADQKVLGLYQRRGPQGDPELAEIYAVAMKAWVQQSEAVKAADQAMALQAQTMGAPPPPSTPLPPKPPPPIFLPPAKQDRIVGIWKQLITNYPGPPLSLVDPEEQLDPDVMGNIQQGFLSFLEFRAAYDAYRLLDRGQVLGAAIGIPPIQAPGQGTTSAPVTPGADAPPVPLPPNPANPPNPPGPGARSQGGNV